MMREEDESNIRGGETDMDLYTPVPICEQMVAAAGIAVSSLGHIRVPNRRCTARYKAAENPAPGPKNLPVWCDLDAGHAGPHKHVSGHRWITMDRESLIEMKPLPDLCSKCGTRWPCKDVEAITGAILAVDPGHTEARHDSL